jgi:hypothetical protein
VIFAGDEMNEGAHDGYRGWRMRYDAEAEKYTMTTIYELLKFRVLHAA